MHINTGEMSVPPLRVKSLTPAIPVLCLRRRYATYEVADRCRWAMTQRSQRDGHIVWCEGCQAWHVRQE